MSIVYCILKERKKNYFYTKKTKITSILEVSEPDPDPEPDPILSVRIRTRRSGSDRIRIRNTVFK
jgi:hypothetical protein